MLRVYKQNCYLLINSTLLSSCVCVKNVFSTPNIMEQILKKAEKARESLIPSKSEAVYQKEYKIYLEWLTRNNVMPKDATETVLLAYFQELSETYSPNSLWTKWSMLKSKVNIHEKRDIAKFNELEAFLKRKSKSYKPKKSAVLSPNDVIRFLKNAPNEIHLLHKVVLIMGYFGGCRSQELLNMKISDIEDRDSVMVVNVPESKTGVSKKFTIVDEKEFSALPLLRLYIISLWQIANRRGSVAAVAEDAAETEVPAEPQRNIRASEERAALLCTGGNEGHGERVALIARSNGAPLACRRSARRARVTRCFSANSQLRRIDGCVGRRAARLLGTAGWAAAGLL
ncbi:uncharacterized protein LOC111691329 [Anoplophora glabripennis]|uniref:uncharacterized protein LOC111691329 n=1 Tax=Anoplophora glabripennis TaxID=217634 RepID=UPI000C778C9A|nr:uncharacterized protein LOC111691329 [Anoplophora glabripennis]